MECDFILQLNTGRKKKLAPKSKKMYKKSQSLNISFYVFFFLLLDCLWLAIVWISCLWYSGVTVWESVLWGSRGTVLLEELVSKKGLYGSIASIIHHVLRWQSTCIHISHIRELTLLVVTIWLVVGPWIVGITILTAVITNCIL